ncbi:hypothetical protein ABZS66_51985 [Dactylosporangium sp. NPDC005572]|uniref:RICIN domain-containing protein n=1 Tax=Dactylosporangium sp. NPDC005572 TaxID=3156889 RepID=UPI0033B69CCD
MSMALTIAMGSAPASASTLYYHFKGWIDETGHSWCLDVQAETAGNVRTNVQIYRCRAATEQPHVQYQAFAKETFAGQPSTNQRFVNKATNKCLTYNVNGVPSPGSPGHAVWAESCGLAGQGWRHTASSQQWEAIEYPGMCLDTTDGYGTWGGGVDVYPCAGYGYWTRWSDELLDIPD